MRRTPPSGGHPAILLAMIWMLCLLLWTTLTPLTATHDALNALDMDEKYLAVAMIQGGEDGRVTDEDGRIGKGQDGADRPATDDSIIRDALPHIPDTPDSEPGSPTGEGPAPGILPWIIGSLVVLAVVLVVLALLPKKNRSHR